MNYRHAFHAGNFADVMKHALLARILVYLASKQAPYRVIDTHAGCGAYDLSREAPRRTGEWREGIGRLRAAKPPPDVAALLAPYLSAVEPGMAAEPPVYPGSPVIAQALMRTQDRLVAIEKHPRDVQRLFAALSGDRRAKALELDGWTALNAQVPPPEKRGLVLVDPPFEEPGEFARLTQAFVAAHHKWPGGVFALWYPIKDPAAVETFVQDLQDSGIRKLLRLELWVDRADADGPLAGSGLIVASPPWTLKDEATLLLAWLSRVLGRSAAAGWRAEWITPE